MASLRLWTGLLILVGVCCASGALAQAVAGPVYDVVSIKPNKTVSHSFDFSVDDGIYNATNVSLKMLIEDAYNLKTDGQLSGLPGWTVSAAFDIEAKMDPDAAAAMKKENRDVRDKQEREMMQALLADRFRLKIHHEMKMLPAYALVVTKGGVKFKDVDLNGLHSGSMQIHNQKLTATGISMDEFAGMLSQQVQREVVNKTGLAGRHDFTMQWSREDVPLDSKAATGADSWPSIYTALQEQLGLKLDAVKAPVDTIVVDHVEEPSAN